MSDPGRRAETYWVLARAQVSAGCNDDAIKTVRQALASAGLPPTWQARMLALIAMLERAGTGDLDAADASAHQALAAGQEAGAPCGTAHALADLWLSHGIRRDHAAALGYIDRALDVLGEDPGQADLHSFALDGRIFTLENLDRWPEAELTLRQAREFAQRSGSPDRATWAVAAGVRSCVGPGGGAAARAGPCAADGPGGTGFFFVRGS